MSVDAAGIGAVAFGSVLLYSGLKGISVTAALQAIVKGESPSTLPDTMPITSTDPTSTSGAAAGSGTTGATASSAAYDSANSLQQLWTANNGPADTAAFAAAVAMAESGGSATVTSANPDGGTNVGIFQLDTNGVGSGYTVAELQNAALNTQITVMTTNGGTDWTEWGNPVTAAVGYHYTPGSAVP
jgi:hypothetical protein